MIKIIQGDITMLAVDAIVNAAKRAEREVRGGANAVAQRRRGSGSNFLLYLGAG